MVQRKRINNDIFIRWAIFKPDGTIANLDGATIISLQARAKVDGSMYNLTYKKTGHILDIQFPAREQKDIGIYNLFLTYSVPDDTIPGGKATYTIDYCNAFELVPSTCILLNPQDDPINIQGIIAAFSYSMMTEEEKNDLASRLSMQTISSLRLKTTSYLLRYTRDDIYVPATVVVSAVTINTAVTEWRVGVNNGTPVVITQSSSPYPEVTLVGDEIRISTANHSNVKETYFIEATDGYRTDNLVVNRIVDGKDGVDGQPGNPGTDGENGDTVSTAFVYKNAVTPPPTPTDSYVPPIGWYVNIPTLNEGERIYMSTIRTVNGVPQLPWSTPIPISGLDGEPGVDGNEIEFIYKLTNVYVAPPTPPNSQVDDYVPSGWTDNPTSISIDWQFEWICVRERKNGVWTNWTTPALWSRWGVKGMDGDSVEYIFKTTLNETAPARPPTAQEDDYVPSGWTDDPVGVNITWKYEWVCTRTRRNGTWGNFSDPALWAKYSMDGISGADGLSAFKSIVFIRSASAPARPTGGSYSSPIPTSTPAWSDGVPAGTNPLYMSTRIFTNTGGAPQQSAWTPPSLASDSVDIDFEYSSVATNPGTPSTNPGNWYDTARPESIWMAMRTKTNNVWSTWQVFKIKGEKGEDGQDGQDGTSTQFIFRRTSTATAPATPSNSQSDTYLPTDWTRTPTGVTVAYKWEWVSMRQKTAGTWTNFSAPALFATYSENGSAGQQGLQGCIVRTSEWVAGQNYRNDENFATTDLRYIDVVVIKNRDGTFTMYKCIATHGPSTEAVHKPGTGSQWRNWWTTISDMPAIYAPMILAPYAVLTFTQTNELVVKDNNGNVVAGMSGGNINFWAGGATPSTGKVAINSDGSGHLASGNILWDAAGNAVFKGKVDIDTGIINNVQFNGAVKTPFKYGTYILTDTGGNTATTPGLQNYNNVMIPGESNSWWTNQFNMPWTADYSGFRATIINEDFEGRSALQIVSTIAPSGKYFFFSEDNLASGIVATGWGRRASSVLMLAPHTGVELLGIDDGAGNFRGWLVLNEIDLRKTIHYTRIPIGYIMMGEVSTEGYLQWSHSSLWDRTISSRRLGEGHYEVRWTEPIETNDYFVIMTAHHTYPRMASVRVKNRYYFTVNTADDASNNDSHFNFIVMPTRRYS